MTAKPAILKKNLLADNYGKAQQRMYTTLELAFIRKENILRVASRINFLEEKAELQILFALITLKHHEQGSTDFIRVAD